MLFAVGAQGEALKLFSMLVSAISLAYGIGKFIGIESFWKNVFVFLFLLTDQLLRAWAYALFLSEKVRFVGIPVMIIFMLVPWGVFYKALGDGGVGGLEDLLSSLLYGVFGSHVVPVYCLRLRLVPQNVEELLGGPDRWKKLLIHGLFPLRLLEVGISGVLTWFLAETACGLAPLYEVVALLGLLGANVVILLVVLCYVGGQAPQSSSTPVAVEPREESTAVTNGEMSGVPKD